MERIKEAIEKAKSQRVISSVGQHQTVQSAETALLTEKSDVGSRERSLASSGTDIHYRQTQVIELDAVHLERQRIVAQQKSHPASWAFDLLRTQVLQKMDENGWRTLAVTSPNPESGKTLVAINLAIAIAQHANRTALLVDLDLRRPRVAASLGLSVEVSLNQVLAGAAGVEKAMVNPGIARLVVLPTRQPMSGSSEILASGKVADFIQELRERYEDRILVVDLPPVLSADDVMSVLPRIDCVLMVVGNGTSTRKEIEESMRRLSKSQVLGVVLNKDDSPSQAAYY